MGDILSTASMIVGLFAGFFALYKDRKHIKEYINKLNEKTRDAHTNISKEFGAGAYVFFVGAALASGVFFYFVSSISLHVANRVGPRIGVAFNDSPQSHALISSIGCVLLLLGMWISDDNERPKNLGEAVFMTIFLFVFYYLIAWLHVLFHMSFPSLYFFVAAFCSIVIVYLLFVALMVPFTDDK